MFRRNWRYWAQRLLGLRAERLKELRMMRRWRELKLASQKGKPE